MSFFAIKVVDEWGTWHNVEPGTNPGFLYQQNTMRDAIVAAETLNIFNRHSDRVKMANIAQLINVLQAVILTDGAKMVLTPTYHVFEMYKEHQGATLVQSAIDSPVYERFNIKTPYVSQSASVTENVEVIMTLSNIDPDNVHDIALRIDGGNYRIISARVLTGDIQAYNDFDTPDVVSPSEVSVPEVRFDGLGTETSVVLPPCSVMTIKAQKI